MGEPKSQMRREGQDVQQTVLRPRAEHLHHASARGGQVAHIPLGIEHRSRLRAPAGGERHEDGAELGLESVLHRLTAMKQGAQDDRGAPRQRRRVWRHDKVPDSLRLLRGVHQIEFRREGYPLQILQRAERVGAQAELLKEPPVMGRKGQHHPAQIVPQPPDLAAADDGFRQLMPSVLKDVPFHGVVLFRPLRP